MPGPGSDRACASESSETPYIAQRLHGCSGLRPWAGLRVVRSYLKLQVEKLDVTKVSDPGPPAPGRRAEFGKSKTLLTHQMSDDLQKKVDELSVDDKKEPPKTHPNVRTFCCFETVAEIIGM